MHENRKVRKITINFVCASKNKRFCKVLIEILILCFFYNNESLEVSLTHSCPSIEIIDKKVRPFENSFTL